MAESSQTIRFEKTINCSSRLVYEAFTNATRLREWLCDVATVVPRSGGRIYLAWNSGFYTSGEFLELEEDQKVCFTWNGRGEPAATRVEVQIKPQDSITQIVLEHQYVGVSKEWEDTLAEISDGWNSSLENLASVLESGEDLRFILRPMLGIMVSDFNQEIANQIGVPVSAGIRIDRTIDGMGASAAGLQGNDVIIRMDGQEIADYANLAAVLQRHRAGDVIEVVFYRGGEITTTHMELSRRLLPELPSTIQELASSYHQRQNQIQHELDDFFRDVTDEEASFKPGPDEWSAKEVMAHLIHGERFWHTWITELLGKCEAHYDENPGNLQAPIVATITTYPSLVEPREEYKRSGHETVALISTLPDDFEQRKGSFWRMAYNLMEDPYHHRNHLEQMRAAIEASHNG